MGEDSATPWLDEGQQLSWRAFVLGSTLLFDRLSDDLRKNFGIGHSEYEILVRLSEREGRRMRMAALADAMCHSRSRVTHTVARMEKAGLVRRNQTPEDGRGVLAEMTERGYRLLVAAAPLHVAGVRANLVDLADPEDLAALGRVMNAVTDKLITEHPEAEIR
jgi:DNA-binding MarR family transcriptional regulator